MRSVQVFPGGVTVVCHRWIVELQVETALVPSLQRVCRRFTVGSWCV
jgi:hypothetical protein